MDASVAAFDGLIVDLDGVVWLGEVPIPGSAEAIGGLRESGVRLVFLTNDPRSSRPEYAARMRHMGIAADEADIVTSGFALASILGEREPGARTFVIGSPSLKRELDAAGLDLVQDDADVVAVGGHAGFDYHELRIATRALRSGARLYAAGRDPVYPMPDGPWPGTGSLVAAVEVAGGSNAIAVGKPEPYIFEMARSRLGACDHVAIVGDSLASDIAGGRRAGLTTILVLTGTTSREEAATADVPPDLVLGDLAELARLRSTVGR